jgi:myo-inositol-1(or 4)-monophosphatase
VDLGTALVGTGFSYQPATRAEQGRLVAALLPRVRDIRRFGAASVDLCSVAAGRLDVYVEEGLAPWDLAAGEVIAREAGATVTDLAGGPVQPGSVLACSPGLHQPFLELLGELQER